MKVVSWNINGWSSAVEAEVTRLLAECDIVALQETRCAAPPHLASGTMTLFSSAPKQRLGYSGTALYVRRDWHPQQLPTTPLQQAEGRVVAVRLTAGPMAGLAIVSVYVPNAGTHRQRPLQRLAFRVNTWDPDLATFAQSLGPALLVGDLNVVARSVDIHNPAGSQRRAGYTPEERASFAALWSHWTDVWPELEARNNYPPSSGYTFYARYNTAIKAARKGWRLDYHLCNSASRLRPTAMEARVQVEGSDHVPLVATYDKDT